MYNKTAKPARNAKENERICHQNIIKNSFALLASLRLYSMSLFANRRSRFKAQEKNTRRRAFCTSRIGFFEATQKMPVYF